MGLTNEQLEVVRTNEKQVAVVGPPGTGKTKVLTERIKYLLDNGVNPKDIVAITFTNFAASEMSARLPNSADMYIGTMHSYAYQLLFKNGINFKLTSSPTDREFKEMITKASSPNIQKPQVKYLFVDEVQDLCQHEFDFVNSLIADNIFFAGDADQSIYQFKGAMPHLFINYCRDEHTKTYILTHNFRSGQNIIEYAEYFVSTIPNRLDVQVFGDLINRGWVYKMDGTDALKKLEQANDYKNWFVLTRENSEREYVISYLVKRNIPVVSFRQSEISAAEAKTLMAADAVKVLTIHSAKGLEADYVIVIGGNNRTPEERCIEYVAATRARKELYWCYRIAPKGKKVYEPRRLGWDKILKEREEQRIGIRWE